MSRSPESIQFPKQPTFREMLDAGTEITYHDGSSSRRIKRGPATDIEASPRLSNVASRIISGQIPTIDDAKRALGKVGPLESLFSAFGSSDSNVRYGSQMVLDAIMSKKESPTFFPR